MSEPVFSFLSQGYYPLEVPLQHYIFLNTQFLHTLEQIIFLIVSVSYTLYTAILESPWFHFDFIQQQFLRFYLIRGPFIILVSGCHLKNYSPCLSSLLWYIGHYEEIQETWEESLWNKQLSCSESILILQGLRFSSCTHSGNFIHTCYTYKNKLPKTCFVLHKH